MRTCLGIHKGLMYLAIASYEQTSARRTAIRVSLARSNAPGRRLGFFGLSWPGRDSIYLHATSTKVVNVDPARRVWAGEAKDGESRGVIITSKSDYGIRAALHLARSSDRCTLREIASAQAIPLSICAQIMRKLVAAEIVVSRAGPAGGYCLARDASEISSAQVLRAADRDICIFKCVDPEICECEIAAGCAFREVLQQFGRNLRDHLEQLTLADLRDSRPGSGEVMVGANRLVATGA